ncbi:MAG TPA: family 43 glycosylhydrolase, partial [Candidatus Krumholzibacterium sp.]|nr:family 43 glycosylhydrolase [Candidatus Krumholzibacterium sp.]
MTGYFLSYRCTGAFTLSARVYHARTRVVTLFILIIFHVLSAMPASASPAAGVGSGPEDGPDVYGIAKRLPDQLTEARPAGYEDADPSLMASFDFEGPVFVEPGSLIKDHAFIRAGGLYHLIYITDGEKAFGHASSPDLKDWTVHGPVMSAEPVFNRIWAPRIVEFEDIPGYYIMYYTGVNDAISQTTCLAFSDGDLSKWIPAVEQCFVPWHPDTAWADWSGDSWSNCRDPHFFADDDGTNYLLNTATHRDGSGAIALASSDSYFDWTDLGPLYKHDNWHALESPFLLKRDGRYHLFFVEEQVGGISHMSSPSIAGGWDIMFRAIIDNGHACELLELGDGRYLFSRHSSYALPPGGSLYTIRIDTLGWIGDLPEVEIEDPLGYDWTILGGNAFDHQPVFGDPWLYRGIDSVSAGHEGNWWIGTAECFDGPMMGRLPGDSQGDGPVGAIRSGTFTVTGRSMRLLVGGGDYPGECYVALCDASGGDIIYSETGRMTETMDERIWDLEPLRGRSVYIEIVDGSSAAFGHINVDGIKESLFRAPFTPDPPEDDGPEKDIFNPKKDMLEPGPEPTGVRLSPFPNPFNPATVISVSGLSPS